MDFEEGMRLGAECKKAGLSDEETAKMLIDQIIEDLISKGLCEHVALLQLFDETSSQSLATISFYQAVLKELTKRISKLNQ